MADWILLFGESNSNMDLFAAVGTTIIDPFLYAEGDGRRLAVVSHIDHEKIAAASPDVELLDPLGYDRKELLAAGYDWIGAQLEVSRRALRKLGVQRATVSWDFPLGLAELLRADGVELTVDHTVFEARRRVKTSAQLAGMRAAQRAAEACMARAAELVRACEDGLTSEGVRAAMKAVADEHGCDLGDDVIVAVNGQAASGHDSGSGPIAPGDCVLVDIWPRHRASRCWADMTRTFVAGGEEPGEELRGYWRLAREALDRVVPQIRPGVDGKELHRICSAVFEEAGQPTLLTADVEHLPDHGFLHSLGHGVGLDVHEAPGLGLSGEPLVAGDVVAVEPGCYRKGYGGVRLEDLVLVTEDGCEILTHFPYELTP